MSKLINSQELTEITTNRLSCQFKIKNILPLALAIIGFSIIILSTSQYNAGVSPDSVYYIGTARSIANGNGITSWDGAPMNRAAPMYPFILAAVDSVLKIDPLVSARYLNAFFFGLTVYLSGLLLNKHIRSFAVAFLGTVSVLFSIALIDVSLKVWTEPLFICCSLFYLVFLERYFEKGDYVSLVISALAIMLASLTRFIAIPLILVAIIPLLLSKKNSFCIKYYHVLSFIFVAVFPMSAWLIRNIVISNSLFGYNAVPIRNITFYEWWSGVCQAGKYMLDVLLDWYLPSTIPFRSLLVITGIVVCCIIGSRYCKRCREISTFQEFYPFVAFITLYTVSLLLAVGSNGFLDSRYLSPIFVPTTILLFAFADQILKPLLGGLSLNYGNAFLCGVLVLVLIHPIQATIQILIEQNKSGYFYTSEAWKSNDIIQFLNEHAQLQNKCTIYSNDPDSIYLLTGMKVKWSPHNGFTNKAKKDISKISGVWPQEYTACLVWFKNGIYDEPYLFSPKELMLVASAVGVTCFRDGVIYEYFR